MKRILFLVAVFLFFPRVSGSDGYQRQEKLDILHYEFSVILSDSTDMIRGRSVIDAKVTDRLMNINLDLMGPDTDGTGMTVDYVTVNGRESKWEQSDDRLVVFTGDNDGFRDTVEIDVHYHGVPAGGLVISRNKYGDRTFFADNWPDRGHNYIPCIDHPYDKATVDFIITAPEYYSVVANGRLLEESSLGGHLKLTHWSEGVPVPVKVMAFGAARFAVRYAGTVRGIPVWSWVFPQNRQEGFSDYATATGPLEFYINMIGDFPFEKIANVQSKTTYGGLENASAIFYSENSVTGRGNAVRLIAHELAHQWFGDCVTEADWHHIWLSEGFATYLTSFYMESLSGKERLEEDMKRTREMVLRAYKEKPAPVVDTTITNLMDLLSVNSYQKGGWILHMLRSEIGDTGFVRGLRLFYSRYRYSNVRSIDFQHVMEEISGRDLDRFFHQWLYVAGQPELKIWKKQSRKTGVTDIFIEQTQKNLFEFHLDLKITDSSGESIMTVAIKDKLTKISLSSPVSGIIPDPYVRLLFSMKD
jgi:aminopeptidase N